MAAPVAARKSSISSKNESKKPIPGPTNVKGFLQMIFLHFCKKYLLLDTRYRVGGYLILLTGVAVFFDIFRAPSSYFSDKNNFLNKYFVKLSWGWTLLTVGTFVFLTSRTYCIGVASNIRRHVFRLFIGTGIWYTWVNIIFHHVEHTTGICTSVDHENKRECVTAGFEWLGYDISGHCFILIYCTLLISEEAQIFRHWERITDTVINEDEALRRLTIDKYSKLKELFFESNTYVKVNFVILTMISFIWELMLLMTIVYFHTVPQKFFGGMIAIGSWYITYQVWYKWPSMSPGLPGAEMSVFMKRLRKA